MGFEQLDPSKNLFEYHSVFAASLAVYLNLRKELETTSEKTPSNSITPKRKECLSILKSNIIYAIMLKQKDVENEGIPDGYAELIQWLDDKEDEFRAAGLGENQIVDAMFAMMVKKQEVAGLTASSEKSMVSKMNMLISQVARENRG